MTRQPNRQHRVAARLKVCPVELHLRRRPGKAVEEQNALWPSGQKERLRPRHQHGLSSSRQNRNKKTLPAVGGWERLPVSHRHLRDDQRNRREKHRKHYRDPRQKRVHASRFTAENRIAPAVQTAHTGGLRFLS